MDTYLPIGKARGDQMNWRFVRLIAGLAFLGAVLPSCATELSAGGASIRMASQGGVARCSFLGTVSARFGGNFVSMETNIEKCTIEVRNKAATKGGTHVVMHPPRSTNAAPWGGGNCNNCAIRSADVYRCPR